MASDGYKIKVRPPPEVDKETGNPRIKNPFEKARPAEQLNWWDTDDGRMQATMISERVRRLAGLQEPSRWALALNMMLYYGGASESMLGNYDLPLIMTWGRGLNLAGPIHNVMAMCGDTLAAQLAMSKPQATAIPKGGNYSTRLKAKTFTWFFEGLFQQMDLWAWGPRYFLDSYLFGAGIPKLQVKEGKIFAERIMRPNVYVDEAQAYYGDARDFYEARTVTRSQLRSEMDQLGKLTPEVEEMILNTPTNPEADLLFSPTLQDIDSQLCRRYESWHRPDSRKEQGVHFVGTGVDCLYSEPWSNTDPYVHLNFDKPTVGYWPVPGSAAVRGFQLKINRLDVRIDENMRRMSLGRWMIQRGSKVSPLHLGNKIGTILQWQGSRPIIDSSNTTPPELREERDAEIGKALARFGISQLTASGEAPAGLKSGEALKVHIDVQSQRFKVIEDAYARFFVDIAKAALKLLRDIKMYPVTVMRRREMLSLDFKDVAMDDQDFDFRISPTNYMAGSPEDQIDKATTFAQAGGLDIEETMRTVQIPDVESAIFPKTQPLDHMDWVAEQLSNGKYVKPDPDDDFKHGIPLMKATKSKLLEDGAPDEIIAGFTTWLMDAADRQADAMAAAAPPAPPAGVPTPPPVSPLLPNAPMTH